MAHSLKIGDRVRLKCGPSGIGTVQEYMPREKVSRYSDTIAPAVAIVQWDENHNYSQSYLVRDLKVASK